MAMCLRGLAGLTNCQLELLNLLLTWGSRIAWPDGVSEHIATGQNEAQWGKLTGSERERERDGVTINRPIKQSVPASFCPQIASSAFRSETSILWAMGNVDWQYLVSRN